MTQPPATPLSDDPADYLAPTAFLDFDHPRVRAFVDRVLADVVPNDGAHQSPAVGRAVALYYAVRDEILYDPYAIRMDPPSLRASHVLERGRGYCIQKAALYAAACRGAGIPARPGYADVQNHLTTEKLQRLMRSNVFVYHGYVEVWLGGRWLKATPVFNRSLCEKFHVRPLPFDGRRDSLFQPFDAKGRLHLEYIRDRGVRADVPFDEIREAMLATYPHYFEQLGLLAEADFESEAAEQGEAT